MTHITKEGLLLAIEEQRGLALLDGYKPTQLDNILARAAELSAQQDKRKSPSRERVEIIAAWLRRNGTDQQADAVLALLEDNEALCEAVDKRIAERDEARALSAQESKPVEPLTFTVKELNGFADDCAQVGMHGPKMALYQFAAMVNAHGSKPVAWHKPTREDAKKLRESYKSAKTEEGGLDDWLFALEECGFVLVAASVSAQDASPKDGWKLVPLQPTREMLRRVETNLDCCVYIDDGDIGSCPNAGEAEQIWKVMLAAAPEPTHD
jgi:hypothetical protein